MDGGKTLLVGFHHAAYQSWFFAEQPAVDCQSGGWNSKHITQQQSITETVLSHNGWWQRRTDQRWKDRSECNNRSKGMSEI
jgi:hypothetical protein